MENEDYVKSNRENAIAPKSHSKHWCNSCDVHIVSSVEKCAVCSYRETNRLKKYT